MCENDNFIGSTFPTPKGGVLTVTGHDGINKKYICECSICSKDKELWPTNSIKSVKASLLKGNIPCSCSKSIKYSKRQAILSGQRLADRFYREGIFSNKIKVVDYEKGKYTLICSCCSQDQEMWPDGSIKIAKLSFGKGLTGCGCTKPTYWSEEQHKLILQRDLGRLFDEGYLKNRLTVVGDNGKSGRNKRLIMECEVCSKDTELWPYGSISGFWNSLSDSNTTPCGCSKAPKYTEEQWVIRVKRECENRGYLFHGWDGHFKSGNKTRVFLENPVTNNKWKPNVVDFMSGYGDPVAGRLRIVEAAKRPEEELRTEILATGAFDGCTLYRNNEKKDYEGYKSFWNYTCPVCSNDEFVKAGVCNGVFTQPLTCMKAGHKSCRCSSGHRWSIEEREYQIFKKLTALKGEWVGWVDDYKNSSSKFEYICSYGVTHKTDCNHLINGDILSCNCAGGYSRTKSGNLYITSWKSDSSDTHLIKFGITNKTVLERQRTQKKKNKGITPNNLYSYHHENGGLIADIESELKQKFKQYLTVPKHLLPDGYTESFFYNEDIIKQIKQYVEERLNLV